MNFVKGDKQLENLICVIDVNADEDAMAALAKAYAINQQNCDIKFIIAAPEDSEFKIALYNEVNGMRVAEVEIRHTHLLTSDGAKLLLFREIEDLFSFTCGLEFRDIQLNPKKFGETNPHTCFRYMHEGVMNYMCVKNPVRTISKARSLLKAIHMLCIRAKLEDGLLDAEDANSQMEEDDGVVMGGMDDGDEEYDPENGLITTASAWMELGGTMAEAEVQNGAFKLFRRKIQFIAEDGQIKQHNILNMHITCLTDEPCLLETFITRQSKEMTKFKYQVLTK